MSTNIRDKYIVPIDTVRSSANDQEWVKNVGNFLKGLQSLFPVDAGKERELFTMHI